jgi:DNA-binding LacI/PurR family transcriptional regulator
VRAQLVEAGERAVATLLSRLAGDDGDGVLPLLATTLIVRGSTGVPPQL